MTRPAEDRPAPARRPWAAIVMIALTAAACLAALGFRTPLRARYWAWQVVRSDDPAEQAVYLTALCNAGDAGRWGTCVLLGHERAEIRQLGTVVLQHVPTGWARAQLLGALADPNERVRELAAVGLAVHGDNSVLPTLKQMYRVGDPAAATAACVAFERLGTADALATLGELAREPADESRRAALVDALAGIGEPAGVPPLVELLSDHRVCDVPPRSARLAQAVLGDLAATGRLGAAAPLPETQPASRTIAERAAAALAQITGLSPPFSSDSPPAEQRRAAQQWAQWYANGPAPP